MILELGLIIVGIAGLAERGLQKRFPERSVNGVVFQPNSHRDVIWNKRIRCTIILPGLAIGLAISAIGIGISLA
jgi:hypothetical protein